MAKRPARLDISAGFSYAFITQSQPRFLFMKETLSMFNPIRAIRDAGAWTADTAGNLAAKIPVLKSMSPKQKSFAAGVVGTVLGVGVFFVGAEIALPSLLVGGLLSWWGVLMPLGPQLLGIGAAASGTAVFGAGMIKGADNHCGIATRVADAADRMAARVEDFFTRTRAPQIMQSPHIAPPAPGEIFAITSKPAEAFAAAIARKQAHATFGLRRLVHNHLKV